LRNARASKSAADDRLEVRTLRSPAEPLGCSARIGYKHRRVAWPLGNLAPGIARSETASAAAINSRTD